MEILAIVTGWLIAIFIGVLGGIILYYVIKGKIDLTKLV